MGIKGGSVLLRGSARFPFPAPILLHVNACFNRALPETGGISAGGDLTGLTGTV
jgi:hypothetical protein